jgi:hypothetical protein
MTKKTRNNVKVIDHYYTEYKLYREHFLDHILLEKKSFINFNTSFAIVTVFLTYRKIQFQCC